MRFPSLIPEVHSEHDKKGDGKVSSITYNVSTLGHVRHSTQLHFFGVEIADGILGSKNDDTLANNPTAAQTVGFKNESESQEIFELQRLEEMGLCEPIDE
jgi:hypothetical protein